MQNANQNAAQSEHEQKKNSGKSNKTVVVAATVLAVAVVFLGLILSNLSSSNGSQTEKETSFVSAGENEATKSTLKSKSEISQSGSGFPLSFSSNDIVDVEAVGNHVYVVSNEVLFCISSSGKLVFSHVLNYSEPVIKSCGNYGIVFDRLSGKYTVVSKKAVVFSGQSVDSAQIITAQIDSDGNYAIASRSTDSACILTYYDKNGKEKFSWACSKDHIVSVAISSNGQNLACAALSASDGEIETKIYLLNIYSDETVWEYTLKGCAAININFASSSRFSLLCVDKRILLDSKGEGRIVSSNEFSTELLASYSDNDGYCVTLTSKFGSFGGYEIKNYSPNNTENYAFETDEKVVDIFCSGKKTYVLTETEIICVNSFGNESKRTELETAALGMCLSAGNIYSYSLNSLYKD